MKVKELKKKLKYMPDDAEVLVSSPDFTVDVDTTDCYCEYSQKVVIKAKSIFNYIEKEKDDDDEV